MQFSRPLSNGTLKIYNALGIEILKVERINNQEIVIERNNLSNGIYFYKIEENKAVLSRGSFMVN